MEEKTMNIQEFRSLFISRNEKSVLFDALRRLSRMNDLKALAGDAPAWGEWPSDGGPVGGRCAWGGRA
ncbi:MAG: hypothetical protein JF614_16825 [Acidobacteria bacterium]|nr:hypothetical protein [Acidobacteriota bacterium]